MLAIGLSLIASAIYGAADFLAGSQTRRTSLMTVLFFSSLASMTVMTIVVCVRGHALPPDVVLPAVVAGLTAIGAVAMGYYAYAIGVMGIIAPIIGLGTAVPVIVGLARGERPSALQLAGIVIAIGGAFLAARQKSAGESHQASNKLSLVLAVLTAVAFGSSFVFYAQAASTDPYWGVFLARATALAAVTLAFIVMRPGLKLTRAAAAPVLAVGVCDTGGYMLFSLASTLGYLSIVSVFSSVYPVFVVIFAYLFLHDRLSRTQQLGVASAIAGLALIGGG